MHDFLRRLHRAARRLSVAHCALLGVALSIPASSACESCGGAGELPTVVDAGPAVNPWAVRSDEALAIALGDAKAEAARLERRVLLVFVGFHDPDSEAVVRALAEAPARLEIRERYLPLFVNVGREGTEHVQLRRAHDVRKLATLVVLEATGHRVARQTFSPVSELRPVSSAALAQWLSAPHGR